MDSIYRIGGQGVYSLVVFLESMDDVVVKEQGFGEGVEILMKLRQRLGLIAVFELVMSLIVDNERFLFFMSGGFFFIYLWLQGLGLFYLDYVYRRQMLQEGKKGLFGEGREWFWVYIDFKIISVYMCGKEGFYYY